MGEEGTFGAEKIAFSLLRDKTITAIRHCVKNREIRGFN